MRNALLIVSAAAAAMASGANAATPNVRDGLWEITMKMDMPGMPAGMPPQVAKRCITKQEAENPQTLMARDGRDDGRCSISEYRVRDNTASWKMACKGPDEMTGSGTMTFSADSYTGTTSMSVKQGGQAQTMNMHYSGRRLGNCK